MQFSSIVASMILCATAALAAPVSTPTTVASGDLQDATHTAIERSPTQTILPELQVLWNSKSKSTVSPHNTQGHVISNPGEEVITAVRFALTSAQAAGKTCKLVFRLGINDGMVPSADEPAPAKFDLYRVVGCVNDKYGYYSRPTRGPLAGILTAKKAAWDAKVPAAADWQEVAMSANDLTPKMNTAPEFPCEGGEYSFEMVARPGVNLNWAIGTGSGLSLELW